MDETKVFHSPELKKIEQGAEVTIQDPMPSVSATRTPEKRCKGLRAGSSCSMRLLRKDLREMEL
jgi:hypothetical protein